MYEDLYSECPEENPMCDIDIDYLYDREKDDAILCDSLDQAKRSKANGFYRFLSIEWKYILYTIDCREANKFPLTYQSWRNEQQEAKNEL